MMNLKEEKVGKNLKYLCTRKNFLNRTAMIHTLRSIINKLKSLHKVKDTVNRTQQQPTNWEKIFTYCLTQGVSIPAQAQ